MDLRYEKLAKVLTGFSTRLKKGDRVLIDAFDIPDLMVVVLIRAARTFGAVLRGNMCRPCRRCRRLDRIRRWFWSKAEPRLRFI